MANTNGFNLHQRLAADTLSLGRSRLCELRLMNDSAWPWVILVPMRAGIREIYQLEKADQQRLLWESSELSRDMMDVFAGDKMNVAALGNMVPQLHLHHIVRFEGDPAWPAPVWGKQAPAPYDNAGLARVGELLSPVIAKLQS
jgi:diadenosine tetraphosphate (Ap4A) HIT family hydrolase